MSALGGVDVFGNGSRPAQVCMIVDVRRRTEYGCTSYISALQVRNKSCSLPQQISQMRVLEENALDSMFVILSDVQLDRPHVRMSVVESAVSSACKYYVFIANS